MTQKCVAPARTKECEHCKRPDGVVNWVPGHIFVGWGHGWQPCQFCGGSCIQPEENVCETTQATCALDIQR
jgi:hypothetical protein